MPSLEPELWLKEGIAKSYNKHAHGLLKATESKQILLEAAKHLVRSILWVIVRGPRSNLPPDKIIANHVSPEGQQKQTKGLLKTKEGVSRRLEPGSTA